MARIPGFMVAVWFVVLCLFALPGKTLFDVPACWLMNVDLHDLAPCRLVMCYMARMPGFKVAV